MSPSATETSGALSPSRILEFGPQVRYAAVVRGSEVVMRERPGLTGGSSSDSDFYEEALVNPTILEIARRRGDLGCGGLRFVVVSYGLFNQVVIPTPDGHVSIAVEADADANAIGERTLELLSGSSRSSQRAARITHA